MDNLEQIFPYVETFSKGLKKHLFTILEKITVKKGTLLLRENKICDRAYFLAEGLARGYYNIRGKELTSWFVSEGDILTSLSSFIKQERGKENIEVLENSTLYSVSYDEWENIFQKYPEFNLFGRLLMQRYYINLEKHALSLQFDTAKERYEKFIEKQGHIQLRVPLQHLASYLGISKETLSRIRARN